MLEARHHRWEIIESHRFRQQLATLLGSDGKNIDEFFLDSIKNRLCRDPYWGFQVSPMWKTRLIKTHRETAAWLMPVVVQYMITDETNRTLEIMQMHVDKKPKQ